MEKINSKCTVSIIDHVGKKAGMDCYSGSLGVALSRAGCDVAVYSNFIGIDHSKIEYHKYYEGHSKRGVIIKIWLFIVATFKAAKEAKKRKSDFVIMHLFSANLITFLLLAIPKMLGLKITLIAHDVSSFTDEDNKFLQNIIYNFFTHNIIVHNDFSKKMLLKNVKIRDVSKVVIIKTGGYCEHIKQRYTKKEARKELGLSEKGRYILFFGQIKKVKGLDILLKALKDTPEDIKLIIAGKPQKDDIAYYDSLIDKFALQERVIKMIRYIEDDEREKLFYAVDVNVLPYRIIYQSGVLLMAMSYGLPVIASDLEPNKEIIQDRENGLLFKSGDEKSLSLKIKEFFDDSSMTKKMAQNSIKTIEDDYNWDIISLKYLQLIQDKSKSPQKK
jgi:glycosyltransferase involved in cell wall biosynthesis